jgi:general secretion pathway protein G
MERPTPSGENWGGPAGPRGTPRSRRPRARNGFTLIEIMIVMAIIVILIATAIPYYQKAIIRSRESVLKNNLFTMRTLIDEYSYDKQKAPQALQDLVTDGYLREVPRDPMTGNNTSWRVINEDAGQSINSSEPGIFDVRSGSDKMGLDGTPYSEW